MITIYNQNEENFATLGLGALSPTECDVDWEEGGRYDLTMKHPVLDDGKWMMLQTDRIIRAPSPVRESPEVEVTAGESTTTTVSREIYKVKTPKGGRLNLRKGPSTSTKVLGSYKPGTLVVKTGSSGAWTRVLLLNGGRSGWMYTDYITYVRTETETVTTA
ncbi:MAG: SH3 domain-containing protein, partial [Clostridia bacterium]|nr:SH3 domain-containing protein [Clostridia bacterium]